MCIAGKSFNKSLQYMIICEIIKYSFCLKRKERHLKRKSYFTETLCKCTHAFIYTHRVQWANSETQKQLLLKIDESSSNRKISRVTERLSAESQNWLNRCGWIDFGAFNTEGDCVVSLSKVNIHLNSVMKHPK